MRAWWAEQYLHGLLGACPRKSIEPMALALGLKLRPMQHFIGQSAWPIAPLLTRHQTLVGRTLGAPDGVYLVDESEVAKHGHDSVGVASQYCGSVWKVANSQARVYLGYASTLGYTLLDGQLFVPNNWFADDHAVLRTQTGMPAKLTFQTKPQIALALLTRSVAQGAEPARWLAVDALYGDRPAFRDGIAALGLWFFTAIAGATLIWRRHPAVRIPAWSGRGRKPTKLRQKTPSNAPYRVDELVHRLPKTAWKRVTIKERAKGPIVCDLAVIRVTEARAALKLCQGRLLLISVLPKPVFDAAAALERVRYYHRRNHAAAVSHRKRTLTRLAALGHFAL